MEPVVLLPTAYVHAKQLSVIWGQRLTNADSFIDGISYAVSDLDREYHSLIQLHALINAYSHCKPFDWSAALRHPDTNVSMGTRHGVPELQRCLRVEGTSLYERVAFPERCNCG